MNVEVNETEQSIEVCAISDIGIFQLSREIEVQITTQDGTAVGKLLSNSADACYRT